VEHGHASVLSMETADIPAVEQAPVQIDDAYYRRQPKGEPLFNQEQQKAFDKAFSRRERKIRAVSEAMRKDLLDTLEVTHQLLGICGDRIAVADQRAIRNELNNIRLAYGGTK
jgi:hypothetical protein